MSKINGGVKSMRSAKLRRQKVLDRLSSQLKAGYKSIMVPDFAGIKRPTNVDLSDKDKERINKEIETLKTRI